MMANTFTFTPQYIGIKNNKRDIKKIRNIKLKNKRKKQILNKICECFYLSAKENYNISLCRASNKIYLYSNEESNKFSIEIKNKKHTIYELNRFIKEIKNKKNNNGIVEYFLYYYDTRVILSLYQLYKIIVNDIRGLLKSNISFSATYKNGHFYYMFVHENGIIKEGSKYLNGG